MKYLLLLIFLLFMRQAFPQKSLPVIKASSKSVTINDGGYVDKNTWSLSPKARPDVYTADRARKTKSVIFYTDIDSIKVKLRPGAYVDFIVLLNGKDSCYTRIISAIPPQSKASTIITHDTIPFTLSAFNAIHVKAVINNKDTVNLHLDLSSFDFRLTREAILERTSLLSGQPDAIAGKTKPDFNNLDKVFKIKMGNAVWTNPDVFTTGFTSREMDGRFGWNIFEGKQVEIDYNQHLIVIHSSLPKISKGYVSSPLKFIRSFVYIEATVRIHNKNYPGNFLLDNGADQAMIADSAWFAKQPFSLGLQLIRSSVLKDPRGVQYETKMVLCPMLQWSRFSLTDIPTLVLAGKNPTGLEINYLGNDLLKRFNMILDFKSDRIYLKPNKLMRLPFKEQAHAG